MRTRLAIAFTAEAAIAACMPYVDLHPIRAGILESPEIGEFKSVKEDIDDLQQAEATLAEETKPPSDLGAKSPDKPLQRTVTAATRRH